MLRGRLTAAAIVSLTLCLATQVTAATPTRTCEAGKNGVAGKYAKCLHKAQQVYLKGGESDAVALNDALAL